MSFVVAMDPALVISMRRVADTELRKVINDLSRMAIDAIEPRRRGLGLEEAAARLATLERAVAVRRAMAAAAAVPAGAAVFSPELRDLARHADTVHAIVVRNMDRVTGIQLDWGGSAV